MKNRFNWRDAPEKEAATETAVAKTQTVDIKNLIILNAARSPEARERIIRDLERIEYEDK
jgi:hypothetical protein